MLGLYIHIPFCKKICNYCDFPKRIPLNNQMIDDYLKRLKEEFLLYQEYYHDIDTIYIGGGTPNSLNYNQMKYLFEIFKNLNNIKEYSIELNSEYLDINKIKLLKEYKINRVSLGVQTFNDKLLKLLNRSHNFEMVKDKIKLLRENNFNNINLDFIFGIPFQKLEDVISDLNKIKKLNVEHISYYNLILEDKTVFNYLLKTNKIKLLEDDKEEEYFNYIINYLTDIGYNHYEISNFSKNNKECLHNLKYWENKESIGIGMGASGYLNHIRYSNNKLLSKYMKNYKLEEEFIDNEMKMKEELILGLRLLKGIDLNNFKKKYHKDYKDFNLDKYLDNLLEIKDNHLRFTRRGLMLGNIVFKEII